MIFTVTLPDTTPDPIIQQISQAVSDAGGSVEPGGGPGAPNPGEPNEMGPEVMGPPPGPGIPLPAGPGAGMLPGPAMAQKGARSLRPPALG